MMRTRPRDGAAAVRPALKAAAADVMEARRDQQPQDMYAVQAKVPPLPALRRKLPALRLAQPFSFPPFVARAWRA